MCLDTHDFFLFISNVKIRRKKTPRNHLSLSSPHYTCPKTFLLFFPISTCECVCKYHFRKYIFICRINVRRHYWQTTFKYNINNNSSGSEYPGKGSSRSSIKTIYFHTHTHIQLLSSNRCANTCVVFMSLLHSLNAHTNVYVWLKLVFMLFGNCFSPFSVPFFMFAFWMKMSLLHKIKFICLKVLVYNIFAHKYYKSHLI